MKLDLGKIAIPVDQYASQGNAVLGIRGSGKSYTATYIAERLFDAGIPFIAYDPIGIWRYLRVPAKASGEGYKVVVAGGAHGDIPLPVHGAAEITRAAMRDGVSIVFDLYDISLSKADWRRVVESSLKVLLYENKAHGLRHVFLEEAAEFCPQRLPPGDGGTAAVYSMVERLARMGGNAQLGYTLINQRAEEVNKAVLELCDLLILHRQKGRNSLTALGKWLDVAMVKGKIAEEVPALGNGEAFIWPAGDEPPVKTRIPAKRTFHPDRKDMQKGAAVEAKSADVSAFVIAMRANLESLTREAQENDPKWLKAELAKVSKLASLRATTLDAPDPAALLNEFTRAREEGEATGYAAALNSVQPMVDRLNTLGEAIAETIRDFGTDLARLRARAPAVVPPRPQPRAAAAPARPKPAPRAAPAQPTQGVSGPMQRILDALAWWEAAGVPAPSRVQVAVAARYVVTGGAFQNPLGTLRSAGFVDYPASGVVTLTPSGRSAASTPDAPVTAEELHERVRGILNGPQRKILDPLLAAYPEDMDRTNLAALAGYEPTGGAFQNPLGSLRSLGLIEYPSPGRVVALPVLFLETP